MTNLVIRIVINAVALFAAAYFVPGITITEHVGGLMLVAVVFGLVNALIKPVISILTCPVNVLTLGLFTLVINALMVMLTAWLTPGQLSAEGFWPALLGGIVISIVSLVLSMVLSDNR